MPAPWVLAVVRTALVGLLAVEALAAAAAPALELSIQDVLRAFRARNGLSGYEAARTAMAGARVAAAVGRREPAKLAVEIAASPAGSSTTGERAEGASEPSGEVRAMLSRELVYGVDAAQIGARFRAEARADVLEKSAEAADEERDFIASYFDLEKEALVFAELQRARPAIEGFATLSRRAARLGTLGGLAATQAEIFLDQVMSDIEQSRLAYAARAERLSTATGISVPDVAAVAFEDAFEEAPSPIVPQTLKLAAVQQRQSALELERNELRSRRTVEVGVGVERSWGAEADMSLIGEVTLPLGVAGARESEARALDAERAALRAEEARLESGAERERRRLEAEMKRLAGENARLARRVERLSSLSGKTEAAFRQGQGDISEAAATFRELLDARLEAIRNAVELKAVRATLLYLGRPLPTKRTP